MSLPSLSDLYATPGTPTGGGIALRNPSHTIRLAEIDARAPAIVRPSYSRFPRPLEDWKPRSPRYALDLAATLSSREGKAWLRTADISAGGIKLRGEVPMAIGGRCLIRIAGLTADLWGHVRWKAGNLSGFQFETPMSRSDLFCLLTRQ